MNKIQGVMIHDQTKGIYFGFIRRFPAVCAQGNSEDEVMSKIHTYFKKYMEHLTNLKFEFEKID